MTDVHVCGESSIWNKIYLGIRKSIPHNELMRLSHLAQVLDANSLLPLHDDFVLSFGITSLEPLPRQRPL